MLQLALGGLARSGQHARAPANGEIDFSRLVGTAGWLRLPQATRRRFAHAPAEGKAEHYAGTMQVDCSWAGFFLAQICRLMGTPFAPFAGSEVPVSITLTSLAGGRGIVWDRVYFYPGGAPIPVRSIKRLAADGCLTECVGCGFGMRLAVDEEEGALHFRSRRYFLRLGGFTFPLPDAFSPGFAHVVHTDLGGKRFRFEMTIRHRWFGLLFHQDGIFKEEGMVS